MSGFHHFRAGGVPAPLAFRVCKAAEPGHSRRAPRAYGRGCRRARKPFVAKSTADLWKDSTVADNPEDGFCHLIIRL